jgi:N-acetylglucosamine kinase-like BadF-type ATPase
MDPDGRVLGRGDAGPSNHLLIDHASVRLGTTNVAALAPLVKDVAESGDEVARGILARAGTDLAEGVAAVIDRLGLGDEHRLVSYQGAVLESCAAAREAFVRALRQRIDRVRVEAPRHEPIIGAYMLGRRALNWPAVDFPLEPRT